MSLGYSVAQTARLVCALRWACGRLSEILEAWAAQAAVAPEHSGAAVALHELGGRLAAHRARLDGLQPDSELMAPWRQAAPADVSLVAALDEIASLQGTPERLDTARAVLVPQLLGVYAEICEFAAPHCDGALASAARSLGHDLDRYKQEPGAAWAEDRAPGRPHAHDLDRYKQEPGAPGANAQPPAVTEADKLLSAAGGIVGRSVLRPGDWSRPNQP